MAAREQMLPRIFANRLSNEKWMNEPLSTLSQS
jgi:hypothetical protein